MGARLREIISRRVFLTRGVLAAAIGLRSKVRAQVSRLLRYRPLSQPVVVPLEAVSVPWRVRPFTADAVTLSSAATPNQPIRVSGMIVRTSAGERPEQFSTHYMVTLQLVGPDGKNVGTPSSAHFSQTPTMAQTKEIPLAIPADAAAGRWVVRYTLGAHHHDGEHSDPVLEAERTFFVVPGLDGRLAKIEAAVAAAKEPSSASGNVAAA